MIYAMTFYTDSYRDAGEYNLYTSVVKGKVDKIIRFVEKDIDLAFKEKNKNIFEVKKGAGLWLWKPYCIKKALDSIDYGDFLIYLDAAAYYVKNIRPLIQSMSDDMMVFWIPYIEEQYTKESVFRILDASEEVVRKTNQITASYIIFRKTKKTQEFVNLWLSYCENERIMIDHENDTENRYDQSVLSVLSKKWKIEQHEDISQNRYGKKKRFGQKVYVFRHRKQNITLRTKISMLFRYILSYL